MKSQGMLKAGLAWLACCGMLWPTAALQAQTAGPVVPGETGRNASAADVALRPGGVLWGQVVAANGAPRVGLPVALRQLDREVARAVTDKSGYFVVDGLRGGTYTVVTEQMQGVYRLWTPNTAPPTAQSGALVVIGDQPVRGQCGPLGYWLGNPWIVAGIVAGAIAVPVVIHNQQVHRTASP